MIGRELSGPVWVKSSHSGDQGECVEVAHARERVLIRDSKWREEVVVTFRRAAWCGFLAGLVDPGAGGS